MAQQYPLFLDLTERPVVVGSGGKVATRRLSRLIGAGAMLVLPCTDDLQVNSTVALKAQAGGIWCARADDAINSAAWVPAADTIDSVTVELIAGGNASTTPVAIIQDASTSIQKIMFCKLNELAGQDVQSPAIIIIDQAVWLSYDLVSQ